MLNNTINGEQKMENKKNNLVGLNTVIGMINDAIEQDVKTYGSSRFNYAYKREILVDAGQDWKETTLLLNYVEAGQSFYHSGEETSVQFLAPSVARDFRVDGGVTLTHAYKIVERVLTYQARVFKTYLDTVELQRKTVEDELLERVKTRKAAKAA